MTNLLFSTTKACLIAGFYPILIFLLPPTRKLAILPFFLLFITLALIFHSRTAIGAIIVVTGVWLNLKFDRKFFVIVALLIVVLALINIDSCFGRLFIWYNIICNIGKIPLSGKGAYMFPSTYADWQANYFATHTSYSKAYFVADSPMFAYNEWLQLYIEWGVSAVILLTVLAFINIKLLRSVTGIYKGMVISNLVILVFCLVSFPLHQYYTLSFFIITELIILTYLFKNIRYKQFAIVCIIFIFGGFVYIHLKRQKHISLWQMATFTPLPERRLILDQCLPYLKNDSYFLDNYITVLLAQKDFVLAGNALNNYKQYMNQYTYYMMNGDRLFSEEKKDSAIINYRQASLIIPIRIEPHYKIMIIYVIDHNMVAAKAAADIILQMPTKIPSPKADLMKKDAMLVSEGKTPAMFN